MFKKIWNWMKSGAVRVVESVGALVKSVFAGTGGLLLGAGAGVAAAVAIAPATLAATLADGPGAGVGVLGLTVAATAGLPVIGALTLVASVLWGLVEAGSHLVRGRGLDEAAAWAKVKFEEWDERTAQATRPRVARAAAR
jgi:hypothetical protein